MFFKKNVVKNVQFQHGMIPGKKILGALNCQCPEVPLEAGAPQSFDASYAPAYYQVNHTVYKIIYM